MRWRICESAGFNGESVNLHPVTRLASDLGQTLQKYHRTVQKYVCTVQYLDGQQHFLMFEVVNNTDDNFDTADNNDGNDAKKRSIDNQEDTIEGVENNGDNSTTNEPTTADIVRFFSEFLR